MITGDKPKSAQHVRAGQIGARNRWGEPRVVRLDSLEPPYRRLILVILEAAKAASPAETDKV